jgi:hypothetical protein
VRSVSGHVSASALLTCNIADVSSRARAPGCATHAGMMQPEEDSSSSVRMWLRSC